MIFLYNMRALTFFEREDAVLLVDCPASSPLSPFYIDYCSGQ